MDETATRRKKIDPKLYEVGWEQVPESVILTEQRAYQITPGQVSMLPQNRHPKKADYVLEYRGRKLAVIEAKSDEKDVSEGVEQAKLYAKMLQIRFTYATNGDRIWAIDMGVRNEKGEYLIPSTEQEVSKFPSPQELWQMTYAEKNDWRDKFNLCPFNRGGGRSVRYYQENAINRVTDAIAQGKDRILLTMATGTGKTYTAFQICWKLYETGWNKHGNDQKPRILFIADRNILANQAKNDFEQFPEDAMERINPKLLNDKKHQGRVPKARSIYFTIFQTFMSTGKDGRPYYQQYPKEFFDLVIIDECHRGGANDESEWREVMKWFDSATQLGMTATPKRKINVNTYAYFGDPVYSYSLKQGIEDGYLTPYRVKIAESNIDTYVYHAGDDVEGEIDKSKEYTEADFYHGNIVIRERDEHRVKELLDQIDPDEKTIIFCATQQHAMQICLMVNQYKKRPDANYCERVTADDGEEGEKKLKLFQNNDYLRPTILTTSQKLSTGVDAQNVRNIVLMRPVNNIVEFKQIMGRGTRLYDGKYFFTLYDFVGAAKNFQDPEWDGDPFCPICGNYPCTCHKKPKPYPTPTEEENGNPVDEPLPCPVCGHLPCTCPGRGGVKKSAVKVQLSKTRSLMLRTDWYEQVMFGDELITMEEYIRRLFGKLPNFLNGDEDLREKWSQPETRKKLLEILEQAGFPLDKLEQVRKFMGMEACDMLDVLEYLAYETSPIDRKKRAEILEEEAMKDYTRQQQDFVDYILSLYVRNGFTELGQEKLGQMVEMKYRSYSDALKQLGMTAPEVVNMFLKMQKELYNGNAVVNFKIENQFNTP